MKKQLKATLELRHSRIHKGGIGAFALVDFKKGQKVAGGISEKDYEDVITWKHYKSYPKDIRKKIRDFCIGTINGFIPPENFDFNTLSVEWCFNHSCNGNLGFDRKGDFIALRDIKKGEEICFDYSLADTNPDFVLKCTCKSRNCRKTVTGNDWKDEKYRKKVWPHMLHSVKKMARKKGARP